MLRSQKRKSRWGSKGLFGSKAAKKLGVFERSKDGQEDEISRRDGVVSTSLDGCSIEDNPPKNAAAARFRRNGSKVLSLLGLRQNSGKVLVHATPVHALISMQARERIKASRVRPASVM